MLCTRWAKKTRPVWVQICCLFFTAFWNF